MDDIKIKLSLLPDLPGCYLMKDENNTIIYVGKAKNLKNRVRSYFHGAHNLKTTKLVSEIRDFEYIITASNKEAFVLEINLIKEHNPKYNIMLKDDKTYPFIALTKEKHPRLIVTRVPRKKQNAKYFGPYPNVQAARRTVDILNEHFPLRKCNHIPNKECLYFHMHQCVAPCINKEPIDYSKYIKEITDFLNGKVVDVLNDLKAKMEEASKNLDFERAMDYRDQINSIMSTVDPQKISLNNFSSCDFIGTYEKDDNLAIHILIMRSGSIVCNYNTIIPIYGDILETFENFLLQYYNPSLVPKEIYLDNVNNLDLLSEVLETVVKTPQKGHKRELLDMANSNAKKDLETKFHIYENKVLKRVETIEKLGKLLNIKTPNYIESFDNSNLFGEYPISALVVYKNGQPVPSLFRKYHIKTVEGANDYASMQEVVYRRYLHLLMEDKPLPDLLLMDGGEIQVNAAKRVLSELNVSIPVAGIQKDNHHKAEYLYYEGKLISVERNSDVFLFLANVSQRVHDFAISFFRSNKVKGMFASILDEIAGLGPKRKEALLKKFITIDAIKKASVEELEEAGMPKNIAINIYEYFKEKEEE